MRPQSMRVIVPLRMRLVAWVVYVVVGVSVFLLVYRLSGGTMPPPLQLLPDSDPRRDPWTFGFLFGVISVGLARAFGHPLLVGLVQRRSKAELAKEFAMDVARTGAEVVVETVIDAALGGGGSSSSSGGSGGRRGGSGGGGASGGAGASGGY